MKSLIEANHISITNQLNMAKQEIHERYVRTFDVTDGSLNDLQHKVHVISVTASQALDVSASNRNDIISLKMDISNLKKSSKDTGEKLDDNINRSMLSNLVFLMYLNSKTIHTTKPSCY